MNVRIFSIFVSTILLANAAVAASDEGVYLGLRAAGVVVEDNDADGVDIEYDTGFAVGGQFGYQFTHFRLEGEFAYQKFEGSSENDVNADVEVGRYTLGAYADVPLASYFNLYGGAGIGVASLRTTNGFENRDSAFTWHGEIGLDVDVTRKFAIAPFYRYEWIDSDLGFQSNPFASYLFGISLRYILPWQGQSSFRDSDDGYPPYERDDHYDRHDRWNRDDEDRPRPKKEKSPEEKERDRCGWKGPGCEEEDSF